MLLRFLRWMGFSGTPTIKLLAIVKFKCTYVYHERMSASSFAVCRIELSERAHACSRLEMLK